MRILKRKSPGTQLMSPCINVRKCMSPKYIPLIKIFLFIGDESGLTFISIPDFESIRCYFYQISTKLNAIIVDFLVNIYEQ
jgi:hypothetical protein